MNFVKRLSTVLIKFCIFPIRVLLFGGMIITHHKGEFFKITFGDTTIAFNPISKKSKLPQTKFGADIALVSLNNPDFNGIQEVERKGKELFVINGPGEYEIKSVFVHGLPTPSAYPADGLGGENLINTIYAVNLEGMNLLFLGALKDKSVMDFKIIEDMDSVDILFIPIGNDRVLSPADAQALATTLEAKIIIPMHFDGIGANDALKDFLKEAGQENTELLEKLVIKKRDLTEARGEVRVIVS